jgi:hypothetical protein
MFIVVQEPEAAKPAEIMNELGIENAFNLTGGILGRRNRIALRLYIEINLLLYLIKHNIKRKKKNERNTRRISDKDIIKSRYLFSKW